MQAELRNLWRHAASQVSIITTSFDKRLSGMTISSLTSVSMGPPDLLVSFNCQIPSRTAELLRARNMFVLNLLSAQPSNVLLAKVFAGKAPEGHNTNPFQKYPHLFELLPETVGIPTIKNSSRLLCQVTNIVSAQDHEIIVAKVNRIWGSELPSLIYRNHKFWTLGNEVIAS